MSLELRFLGGAIIFSHFLARANELENNVWTESLGRPGETRAGHMRCARAADSTLRQAVRGPGTPLPLPHTPWPTVLEVEVKRPPCLLPSRTIPLGENTHSVTPLSDSQVEHFFPVDRKGN